MTGHRLKLLIFDSHPVHYKVPVYREIARSLGDDVLVVYASDCSVRGLNDPSFGRILSWDVPLLSEYPLQILNCEKGPPLQGFSSLQTWAVYDLIAARRPRMVLLSQVTYLYDYQILLSAWLLGVPVFIRVETQDEANVRSEAKTAVRQIIWRGVYSFLSGAFWIGKLNRLHLQSHGLRDKPLVRSPYCVDSEVMHLKPGEHQARRSAMRRQLGLADGVCCVAFFGKLIPKKDPELLLRVARLLSPDERARTRFLFVGSGELESSLREATARDGVDVHFAGFVNLSKIADYYLAADVMILPSRRMGETWGLVVNEALSAGCKVIVSEGVGSHVEFQHLPEVRVIPIGDEQAALVALRELRAQPTDQESYLPPEYTKEYAARKIVSIVETIEEPVI